MIRGAHGEVGVGVLGGGHLGEAPDPDLPFHILPGEVHGHPGIGAQLPALGRVIVGEEHETGFVDALEQDDPRGRTPLVEGRDRHRVRFPHVAGGLVVPLSEQLQRRDLGMVEGR